MKQAIEVAVFRAKTGITPEQLQSAALAVTPILSAMPGFISREFGASEDGQFIDIVYQRQAETVQVQNVLDTFYFFKASRFVVYAVQTVDKYEHFLQAVQKGE